MVVVRGGSSAQIDRLVAGLERFAAAGLELPDIEVVFPGDPADCKGRLGIFSTGSDPWLISICSTIDSVYEHELAHAWERTTLTDGVRASFMRLGGYLSWSDRDTPWNERGVEGVAVVIQQGLAGLPLAPSLGRKARRDLQLFELLTGTPAPRLVEWMADNRVACDDRPTTLSRITPDADGTVCRPTRERPPFDASRSERRTNLFEPIQCQVDGTVIIQGSPLEDCLQAALGLHRSHSGPFD